MVSMEKFTAYFKAYNQFDTFNGAEFTIHRPGEVTYRWTIQDKHLSSPGVAHGGAISGFMDCILGLTSLTKALEEGQLVATVEFKMNFIRPAKLGETIIATGKIDHRGKSLIIASADILTEAGELVAKGLGTFNTYPLEKKNDLHTLLTK